VIELIQYGGGNIGSVARCLTRLGAEFRIVSSADELSGKNPLVLPGVGAFGAVMKGLESRGFVPALQNILLEGIPYLGICIGMQILFSVSEESPGQAGLGVLQGNVKRFVWGKVPQIGWNWVVPAAGKNFPAGYAYFVNSFYAECGIPEAVLYTAEYGVEFCAAVKTGGITAYQFHAEKSGDFGQALIRRWIDAL